MDASTQHFGWANVEPVQSACGLLQKYRFVCIRVRHSDMSRQHGTKRCQCPRSTLQQGYGMPVKLNGLVAQHSSLIDAFFGQAKHKASAPGQLNDASIIRLLPTIAGLGSVNQVDTSGGFVL